MRHAVVRGSFASLCIAVLAAGLSPASAEVFAVLGPDGGYADTLIVADPDTGTHPWTARGLAEFPWLALNTAGDLYGDGAPVIAQDPENGRPLVAWTTTLPDGSRAIQVATFDGDAWREIGPIHPEASPRASRPAIAAVDGLPFVAWTELGASPSIWYSRLDASGLWSVPVQLTPAGVMARSPSILVADSWVVISYVELGRTSPRSLGSQMVKVERVASGQEGITVPEGTDGPMPVPPGLKPGGGTR